MGSLVTENFYNVEKSNGVLYYLIGIGILETDWLQFLWGNCDYLPVLNF